MKSRWTAPGGVHPLFILGVAALIVFPAFVFLGARLLLPGDGAGVLFEPFRRAEPGLLVSVSQERPGGLRDGDRVLAIGGHPIDRWLERALRLAPPAADRGSPLRYTVLRGGEQVELSLRLVRASPAELIRSYWTHFLFLAYLWGIALTVFALRPRQPQARGFLLWSSLLFGSGLTYFLQLQPSDLVGGWPLILWLAEAVPTYVVLAGGAVHFALIFPSRKPVLARRPRLPWLVYLGAAVLYGAAVLLPWPAAGTASQRLLLTVNATAALSASSFPLAVLLLLNGYRQGSNAVERRQVRWLLWASLVTLVPWQVSTVIPELLGYRPFLPATVTSLFWLALPTAIAIAIVREGLFDIDRIINRTLVYSLLSVALVAVYFASVALLENAFRALAGQGSQPAVVLSTLAIAALFNPFRRRIQDFIDRRFYRGRYDAAQVLASFSTAVQDQIELEDLSRAVLTVVERTIRPSGASLWVRSPGAGSKAAR